MEVHLGSVQQLVELGHGRVVINAGGLSPGRLGFVSFTKAKEARPIGSDNNSDVQPEVLITSINIAGLLVLKEAVCEAIEILEEFNMGFSLKMFIEELENALFDKNKSDAEKVIELTQLIAEGKEYAEECGKL